MPPVPTLIPSLSGFAGQWIAAIVLFVVLFAGVAVLFARGRALLMLLGFGRTIASLFTSPFTYLRNICLRLADYGERGDAEYRSSRLYLVNKLLIALHAIVIVMALGGLAATALSAWNAFLPPKFLRDAEDSLVQRLAPEQQELASVTARLNQLEQEWTTRRQALVDQYRASRQQKLDAAVRDNESIEATASADEQLSAPFGSIRNYLSSDPLPRNAALVSSRYESVIQFLNRITLLDDRRQVLIRYAENWKTRATMALELSALSEEEIRTQAQPDYPDIQRRATLLGERVQSDQQQLADVRAQLKYSPGAFVLQLIIGLFAFILLVWLLGLFIELLSLSVYAADDIRRLRELADRDKGHSDHGGPQVERG